MPGSGRLSRYLRCRTVSAEYPIGFFAAALAAMEQGRWFNHIRCHNHHAALAETRGHE
jgi:hypothetical protein